MKLKNGLELTWESLDSQERMVMLYAACWLLVTLVTAVARGSRERMRREIVEELRGGSEA